MFRHKFCVLIRVRIAVTIYQFISLHYLTVRDQWDFSIKFVCIIKLISPITKKTEVELFGFQNYLMRF